ncbi:MAG: Eco57I restriction-modification methylase domain-containing protein, partial [Blastocatellia bacterium]
FIFDIADITDERVWHDAEAEALAALREYSRRASNGKGLLRRLFSDDTEQGFAFIDLCRQKFDAVLMNPPFGDASLPSKPYIDETYGDTKGDVYKAFVECFQDRLVPGGFLGIISSRTGFFLSGSSDWRERVVLRLYRPLVLADFGMGVLDAMVETAAYVLRSLTGDEDRQLTLQLANELHEVPTDKKSVFSTKKYEDNRELKRHQASGELRRLFEAGFIKPVEGHFPRWLLGDAETGRRLNHVDLPFPKLVCLRLLGEEDKGLALNLVLHGTADPQRFLVSPETFRQIPNSPFCYWVSDNVKRLFAELPRFEIGERIVRQGAVTGDDARHLRSWWEVSPLSNCKDFAWVPFAKGGKSVPFYGDLSLVTGWDFTRGTFKGYTGLLHRPSLAPANSSLFFKPGLTWLLRAARFCPTVLPKGCIFSVRGYAILAPLETLLPLLAFTSSKIFDYIFKSALGRHEYPEFFVGVLQKLHLPNLESDSASLTKAADESFRERRALATAEETTHVFHIPALL